MDGELKETHAHNIAVVAHAFDEAEHVAIKLRHHAENKTAFGSRWVVVSASGQELTRQQVCVNPRVAIRDNDRADCLFVEFDRTGVADNAVNVTHLAQAPETRQQQRLSDAIAASAFADAGWSKETSPSALVSSETNNGFFARGDKN